jgi:hypothetical protein
MYHHEEYYKMNLDGDALTSDGLTSPSGQNFVRLLATAAFVRDRQCLS